MLRAATSGSAKGAHWNQFVHPRDVPQGLYGVAQCHQRMENAFMFVNRFDCASSPHLLAPCLPLLRRGNEHDFGRGRYSHHSQHRNSFNPCLGDLPLQLMNQWDYRKLTKAAHAPAKAAATRRHTSAPVEPNWPAPAAKKIAAGIAKSPAT